MFLPLVDITAIVDNEMEGEEAIIRKEGNRPTIEPLQRDGLLSVLAKLAPIEEGFACFVQRSVVR